MKVYYIHYMSEDDDRSYYYLSTYYKNKDKAIERLLKENFYDSGESVENYIIYQSANNERSYARIREVALIEGKD